jgi:hypothetical protein
MKAVATLLRLTAGHGSGRDRVRRVAGLSGMRKRVGDFLSTHQRQSTGDSPQGTDRRRPER